MSVIMSENDPFYFRASHLYDISFSRMQTFFSNYRRCLWVRNRQEKIEEYKIIQGLLIPSQELYQLKHLVLIKSPISLIVIDLNCADLSVKLIGIEFGPCMKQKLTERNNIRSNYKKLKGIIYNEFNCIFNYMKRWSTSRRHMRLCFFLSLVCIFFNI